MKIYLISLFLFISISLIAQVPVPAPTQNKAIALKGAEIHIGNGKVLKNATITFSKGLITNVTTEDLDLSNHEIIDVSGKHIYPGFILANTNLGLTEIQAVKATLDHSEIGKYNPNVRTLIAYNTDSELIPTFRFNGILTAQIAPRSGILSGTSSIVQLDAWNWEDASLSTDDGVYLSWPQQAFPPRWWLAETKFRPNKKYDQTVKELETLFLEAKNYHQESAGKNINLKLASLASLFKQKQLFIRANDENSIIQSISFAKRIGLPNIVLVGGEEAVKVADFLKEKNIPLILNCLHRLPNQDHQDVNLPYKSAALLHEKGLLVGLAYDIYSTQSERNLPFIAGTAAAYGLNKEEALKMITLNMAKILKIDSKLGSLEKGKQATLFVSEGDALDMRTNNLSMAFIQGRQIELQAKQQVLYQKYKNK